MLRNCYSLAVLLGVAASVAFGQARIASPYRDYSIRLSPWRPDGGQSSGVLVSARIDGGRVLRLLLDTGASGIALGSRVAKELHLETRDTVVAGLGDTRAAGWAVARSIEIGDLELADCPVTVVADLPVRQADGVIGMNVFSDFRIRLHAAARELSLEAYADGRSAVTSDHLLFVHGRVNGADGVFLVDTGSAVTSLASDVVWPARDSNDVAFESVSGMVTGRRLAPVALEIAGKKLVEREPISMNLAALSQRNGMRVTGVLGFSTLSRTPVTVDYRARLVAFR